MTFLDTNYFLRYLVEPDGPANRTRHEIATALFDAIERGEETAPTTEAVLAEVAYVLASKRQYNLPSSDIASFIAPIIRLPGLQLPRGQKRRYLRALDLWADYPKLGFVDALTAAMVEDGSSSLATFDSDFDAFPTIVRWRPPDEDAS